MYANGLIWFLLIGLLAGWLAGTLMKGGGFGIIGDIIVGVIGALLGGWVFGMLGIGGGGLLGALIMATIGAMLLIFLIRLVKRA
ncbi:MAG: GlsB/YeaQ/YmgE family stress response membrane protein [Gemmatimonadaceae bacterium]